MAKQTTFQQNPGLFMVLIYIVLFFVNALVIYLAHLIFPQHVVLGTAHLTLIWALALSAGKLALVGTFTVPFAHQYEIKAKRELKSYEWMLLYFFINFVTLWLISRVAHILGLGLSSWIVAAILAIILDIVQGGAMMQLEKFRTSK